MYIIYTHTEVHSPLNSFGYWTLNKYYYYYIIIIIIIINICFRYLCYTPYGVIILRINYCHNLLSLKVLLCWFLMLLLMLGYLGHGSTYLFPVVLPQFEHVVPNAGQVRRRVCERPAIDCFYYIFDKFFLRSLSQFLLTFYFTVSFYVFYSRLYFCRA